MLRLIRERAQGVIAWIIVILIIVPFALFGINEYFETDSSVYVAKVNDVSIPEFEYRRVYLQERSFRQQLVGDNLDSPFMNEESIKRSALDRVVNSEVMIQASAEAGFDVGNEQLLKTITSRQEFQTDGVFDQALYNNLLRSNNLSVEEFENQVRRDLMADQFVSGVMDLAIVTDAEIDNQLRIQEQQREIGYMILSAEKLKASGDEEAQQFSDDEIKQHYDKNIGRFEVAEQVSLEYVELSSADMMGGIEVDEEVLRELYEDRIDSFGLPEERRARHILINAEEGASESEVEAARATATELLARLQNGESFEVLAKEFSDDAGSAASGGDLDYFRRGDMVTAFDKTVFAMEKGALSELVRTPFGFHIIKLEDVREGSTKPFEEVRAELEQSYREQQAEDRLYDQLEVLSNLTYENPDSLTIAADQMGLEIREVDFFNRHSGAGIAIHEIVRKAAFGDEVMAGNNSEPLQIADDQVVVIRIKEHKPLSHRPLEEVREDVIALLRHTTAKSKAAALGEAVLAKLKEGGDTAEVAKAYETEWIKSELIKRNDSSVNREVLNAAFLLAKPADGETTWHGAEMANGDYAVIALFQVKEGDPTTVDEATRESVKSSLLRGRSQSEGAYLVDSLKKQAAIQEFPENL